jgi:hypothetical protein
MLTKDQLKDLEVKHVRIAHVRSAYENDKGEPEWEVVLRKPNRTEYKHLRAATHNQSTVADAQEQTVRKLIVYPDNPQAVDQLFEEWPGIGEACGSALLALSGSAAKADLKV